MKIFYDHQIFTAQKFGGISRYFYNIISRLIACNEILLNMGFYINDYELDEFKFNYKKFFGVKKPLIPKSTRLFNYLDRLIGKWFFEQLNNIDIYHSTYYSYLYPAFKGVRVITVHDLIHELFSECFPAQDATIDKKKRIIGKCDGIICVSKSTKNDLISIYNVPEEKIKVIYLANSIKECLSETRLVGEPYILYVGKRNHYKNFSLLLKAYINSKTICNNYKLVCFGGGLANKCELKLINKNHLENNLLFFSGSDEILANLYKHASVFVFPSLYEGFGIPPLEAMHQGCPVLVSNSSSIPEVVGSAGVYFDPTCEEEFSVKLHNILYDNNLRIELIKSGYKQVEKFSWDRCAEETIGYYKSLL